MSRSILLTLLLGSALIGRENPFFPTKESANLPVSSNIPDQKPRLGAMNYTFPDQARVLKEITLTFQNVDGSLQTQVIEIDKAVDWHYPLLFSQSSLPSSKQENIQSSKSADFGFVRFETNGKKLLIYSSKAIIRNFALTGPNRIIVDFDSSEVFTPKEAQFNSGPYRSIRTSYHRDFSRATIFLDGRYRYTLENNNGVQQIICR